jgi:hypothetical protein
MLGVVGRLWPVADKKLVFNRIIHVARLLENPDVNLEEHPKPAELRPIKSTHEHKQSMIRYEHLDVYRKRLSARRRKAEIEVGSLEGCQNLGCRNELDKQIITSHFAGTHMGTYRGQK